MVSLASKRVAVVGVGGVGGWCAEALVRSGIAQLTLVDDDVVAPSNLNRQCCATAATLGMPKVEAMRARLLSVDPDAEIVARQERFVRYEGFGRFDAIVDCIDSVDCKAELLLGATADGTPVFSSLGAAKRTDPTKVEVKRFSKVEGDGLARALRQRFRRLGRFPAVDFPCAVSREAPAAIETLGSMMPVTAAFGMALAARVIAELSQPI